MLPCQEQRAEKMGKKVHLSHFEISLGKESPEPKKIKPVRLSLKISTVSRI